MYAASVAYAYKWVHVGTNTTACTTPRWLLQPLATRPSHFIALGQGGVGESSEIAPVFPGLPRSSLLSQLLRRGSGRAAAAGVSPRQTVARLGPMALLLAPLLAVALLSAPPVGNWHCNQSALRLHRRWSSIFASSLAIAVVTVRCASMRLSRSACASLNGR